MNSMRNYRRVATVGSVILALTVVGGSFWATSKAAASDDEPPSGSTLNLLRQCEAREPPEVPMLGYIACAQYLAGMNDMHALLVGIGTAHPLYCMPLATGVQTEQLVRVFVKHASGHPDQLHTSARASVLASFAEAFPCE